MLCTCDICQHIKANLSLNHIYSGKMASSTIDPPSTQISELSISELKEECQKYTQISVQE